MADSRLSWSSGRGAVNKREVCWGSQKKHCWFRGIKHWRGVFGWHERRQEGWVWRWKSTLSDTITLRKGTTSSPSAPAWALTLTFILAAMTKAQARRPCLNTNPLTRPSRRLRWNEAVIPAAALSLYVMQGRDWCSSSFRSYSARLLRWD